MNPSNFDLMTAYHYAQHTVLHNLLKNLEFGLMVIGDKDVTSYANHVLNDRLLSVEQIRLIEEEMSLFNSESAICFENKNRLKKNISQLKSLGYVKDWETIWLFLNSNIYSNNSNNLDFGNVEKVDTPFKLNIFSKTLNDCFQEDDPNNAEGDIGSYLLSVKQGWYRHKNSNRLNFFLVKNRENKMVAVSGLVNFSGVGYIINVGSIPSARGQGYAKKAVLYAVKESIANGNYFHSLMTTVNSYAYNFYIKLGFAPKFKHLWYKK